MSLLLEVQNPEGFVDIPSHNDFLKWANACWLDESDAGLVIRIVAEQESRDLNRGFRAKDYPTNVLSFQYDHVPMYSDETEEDVELVYLGDLVICAPVITAEAEQQQKDVEHHWAHMVVHGLLHLQGFDHIKEIEADIMEAREIEILRQLGIPNPYETD